MPGLAEEGAYALRAAWEPSFTALLSHLDTEGSTITTLAQGLLAHLLAEIDPAGALHPSEGAGEAPAAAVASSFQARNRMVKAGSAAFGTSAIAGARDRKGVSSERGGGRTPLRRFGPSYEQRSS